MDETRLDELIARHFEGALSDEEERELNTLLQENPEARLALIEAAEREVDLAEALGREIPAVPSPPRTDWRRWGVAAGAAAAVIIAAFTWWWPGTPGAGSDDGTELAPGEIRTTRLADGDLRRLGDAADGRPIYEQLSGSVRYEIGEGGTGLVLRTPAGELRDLGTVFTVVVPEDGGPVELEVAAGAVAFDPARRAAGFAIPSGSGRVLLQEDGGLGRVIDRAGLVQVRPRGRARWSLARADLLLDEGDWIRTDHRGAHAAHLRFANGSELRMGPATLIEIEGLNRLRIYEGEAEFVPAEGTTLALRGAGDAERAVARREVVRAVGTELTALDADPRWLVAYRGDRLDDAMGTLMARVDGRDVPLSMGYQKVTVDIRDQLARTTVETSFKNHTKERLEGTFYFPLPADASVSGFAMWIGDELVEGDIVEKVRAREIYETLVREKVDPALLEWTGGNVFKARVFPIDSEKRIRLVYTQALPRSGPGYRYRYALRSDLTRNTPLERLEILVRISSTQPLAEVRCPTHACRVQQTGNAASLELSMRDFLPTRDFAVEVRPGEGAPLVVLPHRRGDDGYFMMLIEGPESPEIDPRDLVPEGRDPLDLIVVADTSGSLSAPNRAALEDCVRALVLGLGAKDRIQLATVDTVVRWASPEAVSADDAAKERLLRHLEARDALGWTDLEAGLREAFARARPNTQIVYVGDGRATAGDTDPGRLVLRLEREHRGRGVVHAVGIGSSYEALVLGGLARLGSGTERVIGDDLDPQEAAADLMKALVAPRITDLSLRFEGIDVAAVRPARLESVAAGSQTVLVGRYDPEGASREGRVVLTGRFGEKEVRREADFALPEDGAGNSFTPRLWARRQLDHLLLQGGNEAVRAAVIALSERYQIVTPYTSFLVLETDADRERFGVTRRTRMRDGEEFFAEGRDRATFELGREALQEAQRWRKELRKQVLSFLRGMGREAAREWARSHEGIGDIPVAIAQGSWAFDTRLGDEANLHFARYTRDFDAESDHNEDWGLDFRGLSDDRDDAPDFYAEDKLQADTFLGDPGDLGEMFERQSLNLRLPMLAGIPVFDSIATPGYRMDFKRSMNGRGWGRRGTTGAEVLVRILPTLGTPSARPLPVACPEEIAKILDGLDLGAWIAGVDGGLELEIDRQAPRNGVMTPVSRSRSLISGAAWWQAIRGPDGSGFAQWYAGGTRGTCDLTWQLGVERRGRPGDDRGYGSPIPHHFGSMRAALSGYRYVSSARSEGRLTVVFAAPPAGVALEIDEANNLLTSWTTLHYGHRRSSMVFSDPVEVGGRSIPTHVVRLDASFEKVEEMTVRATLRDATALAQGMQDRLGTLKAAFVIAESVQPLAVLKQRVADGAASPSEMWQLLLHHAGRDDWDRAQPVLERLIAALASETAGSRIRLAALIARREHAPALELAQEIARALAAAGSAGDLGRARTLLDAASIASAEERRGLLEILTPVFARRDQIDEVETRRLQLLREMGREQALLELLWARFGARPDDLDRRRELARELARRGNVDKALEILPATEHAPRIDLLRAAWREREVLGEYEAWTRRERSLDDLSSSDWRGFLLALFRLGLEEEAEARIGEWLEFDFAEDAPLHRVLRFEAARDLVAERGLAARGRGFRDRWAPVLCAAIRRGRDAAALVPRFRSLLQDDVLVATRAGRKLVSDLATEMDARLAGWSFDRLALRMQLLGAVSGDDLPERRAAWLEKIVQRWLEERSADHDRIVGDLTLAAGTPELHAKMLGVLGESAVEVDLGRQLAASLLDHHLRSAWSAESEQSAFDLYARLAATREPEAGATAESLEAAAVARLMALVDWMVRGRVEAGLKPETSGSAELELGRRALAQRRKELTATARIAVAEKLAGVELAPLAPWIEMERLQLGVEGASRSEALAARGLAVFEAVLDSLPEAVGEWKLEDRLLVMRTAVGGTYLVAADDVPEALRERWLALADARLADPASPVGAREIRFWLLVARGLDDEIQAALTAWAGDASRFAALPWARILASWRAGAGDFEGAVTLLEEVEKRDELEPEDYAHLAAWHQARGERGAQRAALLRGFLSRSAAELESDLWTIWNRVRRRGDDIPEELPEDATLRLIAALRRAPTPHTVMDQLTRIYAETRDFRVLDALPEAFVGMAPGRAVELLAHAAALARCVPDEAALDRFRAGLARVRAGQAADTDARALALLELRMLVGALDQIDQPEAWREPVLAAFRAGVSGAWSAPESRELAAFLATLHDAKDEELRAMVLEELRACVRRCERGSDDHLATSRSLSDCLRARGSYQAAADALEVALAACRERQGGLLLSGQIEAFDRYVDCLRAGGLEREAESAWRAELARDYPPETRNRLQLGLFGALRLIFDHTPESESAAVFQAVRGEMLEGLREARDPRHAGLVMEKIGGLHLTAHAKRGIGGMDRAWREIAWTEVPALLGRLHHRGSQNIVHHATWVLRQIVGVAEALDYLVGRAEAMPRAMIWEFEDPWSDHASKFIEYRRILGTDFPASLKDRLLQIVLREMREYRGFGIWRYKNIYDDDDSDYWAEKAADFLESATTLARGPDEPESAVQLLADYIRRRHDRASLACDLLLERLRRVGLSPSGRSTLITWLAECPGRADEALALAGALIADFPDELSYRLQLMKVQHARQEPAGVVEAYEAAIASVERRSAWTPWSEAQVASACTETGLDAQAVQHYRDAVARARSLGWHLGRGDHNALRQWYRGLAVTLGRLGRTAEAVDAIAGAWAAATRYAYEREELLGDLRGILESAPDLDAYIAEVDREAAVTGQENAVLRREIGRLLAGRSRYQDALRHLRIAMDLGRPEAATRDLYVDTLDRAGRRAEATALLQSAAFEAGPKGLDVFASLARRYDQARDAAEAERARTQIIELQPNEAASHRLLAGIREEQKRYEDALAHWIRVAEIRPEEPEGLLGQARTLIRLERFDEARTALERLRQTSWHPRFDDDLQKSLTDLQRSLDR